MESKKFSSLRLQEAQCLAGVSNADLAEDLEVSTDMVSKWRRDISTPREKHVEGLAKALQVPAAFFFRTDKPVDLSNKLLRRAAQKTRSRKNDDAQRYYLEYLTGGIEKVFSKFDLSQVDLPDLKLPDPLQMKREDVEEVALELRKHWQLGGLPIRTLANLLFSKGIIVQRTDMDWDGVSFVDHGRPFIFIKDSEERSRDKMTIAHELGHVVLHHTNTGFDNTSHTKKQLDFFEKQAFFFGTCFLAPRATYTKDIYSANYHCLKQNKPKWQFSIAAQIMHLHGLGCISDEEKTKLFRAVSWHQKSKKREPHEEAIVYEECDFLQDGISNLEAEGEGFFIDEATHYLPFAISSKFRRKDSVIVEFKRG